MNLNKAKMTQINPLKYSFKEGEIVRSHDNYFTIFSGEDIPHSNTDRASISVTGIQSSIYTFIFRDEIDSVLDIKNYPEYYL